MGDVLGVGYVWFFFFKQEAGYEVRLSLVGSEMGIRDRWAAGFSLSGRGHPPAAGLGRLSPQTGKDAARLKIKPYYFYLAGNSLCFTANSGQPPARSLTHT